MEQSARKAYSRVGLAIVLYVVLTYAASFLCMFVFAAIDRNMLQSEIYYWISAIVPQYVIAFPVIFLILFPLPKQPPEKGKLSISKLLLFFVVSFGISMIGNIIGIVIMNIITSVTGIRFEAVVQEMFSRVSVWYNIVIGAILAPVFEELFFRKLMIDRLAPYGQKSAIIISALLFGLLHGNLSQLIYATFIGVILGHIYCRTGKVRYTIAIHMCFNAIAGVFTAWLTSKLDVNKLLAPQSIEDKLEFILEKIWYVILFFGYELIYFVSTIAAVILTIIFIRREYAKLPKEILPKGELAKAATLNVGMISAIIVLVVQFILNIVVYNS